MKRLEGKVAVGVQPVYIREFRHVSRQRHHAVSHGFHCFSVFLLRPAAKRLQEEGAKVAIVGGQSNSKSCLSRSRCESPQFEWFLKRLHKI